jgi:hypothetical protein
MQEINYRVLQKGKSRRRSSGRSVYTGATTANVKVKQRVPMHCGECAGIVTVCLHRVGALEPVAGGRPGQ